MTTETIEPTAEQIRENAIADMLNELGLEEEEVLTDRGDYGSGLWHNELRIDLEDLKDDKLSAFRVIKNIHDTAGMSFREYYGIDKHADLPNGVIGRGIADLCVEIWNCRQGLTAGFDTKWDGDWKAVWTENEDDTSVEDARDWWDGFKQRVGDLPCSQVYDLSDSMNNRFQYDELKKEIAALEEVTADSIQELLEETYQSDTETTFTEYSEGARLMFEKWTEDNE